MKVIYDVKSLKEELNTCGDKSIGFVPTMGYLHEGHLSLVTEAKNENDIIVMSIFVNPLQFGPNEDLDTYPRDEERDCVLAEAAGVDILFMPSVEVMYPNHMSIQMTVTSRTDVLCGQSRPGHFDGVVTVLTKLFHLIMPTRAYFGLKDAQQFAVVHYLVKDLNFPLTVIGLQTVRERDGLAKSSRNVYLSETERKNALALYRSLQHAKDLVQNGWRDVVRLKEEIHRYLEHNCTGTVDYVDILRYPDLTIVDELHEQVIIAVAVHFAKARLIDNIILTKDGHEVKTVNGEMNDSCFVQ